MLFVDEFCGILVYIKFGADVTSQYVLPSGFIFIRCPPQKNKNIRHCKRCDECLINIILSQSEVVV